MNNNIPWVEKYRPNDFNNIILNNYNKTIFNNMINYNIFPNLLFYGPPGTGKTTTIINLINLYQSKYNQVSKSLILHLNASDDRGIEIIRNNINIFVKTNNLFCQGIKFIILDEVDCMTKPAQYALKVLIQNSCSNVKYCLICNYISKIENCLQNEFLKIRFNNIPQKNILDLLNIIKKKENINVTKYQLKSISDFFESDIRSMINYLQINYNKKFMLLNNKALNVIYDININNNNNNNNITKYIEKIYYISNNYEITVKNLLKNYLIYLINNNIIDYTNIVNNIQLFFHETENKNTILITYVYYMIYNNYLNTLN
tara:strand:- start:783 stop:1730 length:948 start_codon:yes stop_codon:yes gene_type:complete